MKCLKLKKHDAIFGRYPLCDMINNAIRYIIRGNYDLAIDELFRVILQADGYFHQDLGEKIIEAHNKTVNHFYEDKNHRDTK